MAKATKVKKGNNTKKSEDEGSKEKGNPWKYCESLPTLLEDDKMSKGDIAKFCCKECYCIKLVKFESEEECNNDVYQIFGTMIGQDNKFMRQWI